MRAITAEASRYIVIFGGVMFLFLSISLLPQIDDQLIEMLIILIFCAIITPFFIKAYPRTGQGMNSIKLLLLFLVISGLIAIGYLCLEALKG